MWNLLAALIVGATNWHALAVNTNTHAVNYPIDFRSNAVEVLRYDVKPATADAVQDESVVLECNASGGAFDVVLPDGTDWNGTFVIIVKTDVTANAVSVIASNGAIHGGDLSLGAQWEAFRGIKGSGTNWYGW